MAAALKLAREALTHARDVAQMNRQVLTVRELNAALAALGA